MRLDFDTFGCLYLFAIPFVVQPFLSCWLTPYVNDDDVNGYVDERFKTVLEAFRRNFGQGEEREGAAFAVHYKGKDVVNLWGGYADKESGRKWRENTKSVMFSASKAISSIVIAVMVDRGLLNYEDRVVDYWPEYGRYGKNLTTIEDVLSHKAGLPYLSDSVSIEDVKNGWKIMEKVENSVPAWAPGTASGYHAVTFGFILDGLVRKADPRGRDIKTFFEEEIAKPYDLDIQIGATKEEVPYLARLTMPSFWEFTRDIVKDPKILIMLGLMYVRFDTLVDKMRSNPDWLLVNYDTMVLNDPEIVSLNLPAVTAVGTVRDVSRLLSMIVEKEIISNTTLLELSEPTLNSWHLEKVTIWPVIKGHGFFYEKHPLIPGAFTFGHPGYGGQFVHMDPKSEISITYLSNGLKTGTGELCGTYIRLFNEVYNSIRRIENEENGVGMFR
ncbi:CBN-LACT-6 protein [Caenorhabditis brenneri]|uniref:CBN-LACT-6 protein n=1 Tax=Caenorhabditis brenneri TaxID=135651 RepID=G0MRD4_CAEBE|nr:CBN-LACT-6 protein [Caenorhabditis brenneri]